MIGTFFAQGELLRLYAEEVRVPRFEGGEPQFMQLATPAAEATAEAPAAESVPSTDEGSETTASAEEAPAAEASAEEAPASDEAAEEA